MDGSPRPTGTVAFLFTDIEGSTEAWEADPDAMGAAVVRLEEILDATAGPGRRAVEQGAGDSAVIAFERARDAAVAALALQQAVAAEPWATARPLRVRAALHLGEVEIGRDGTYRGPTMNRCGRLLGAAHGGQVVASGSFVALLDESDDPDGSLAEVVRVDLGSHRLRGIETPMRIWQLTVDGLDGEFPPLRTVDGRGLHLPATSSPLIGREADLDRLRDLVADNRVVTVLGSGGSGKTRLAVELAHAALDDAYDEIGWVDLAKVTAGDDVDALVVAELSIRHGARRPRARIVDHLRAQRALLVLDNAEHVLTDTAALVAELADQCPMLRVVTTSREPLELAAEALLRLAPLAVPVEPDGSDLAASAAGALLLDRLVRVRPGTGLTGDDETAAAEICRRLDGIPLALELAAARARSMPLPVVAARLEERFALLIGGGRRHTLARQRTLEASVAWSYDLLADDERAALRHLSTFVGPFDLAAAAAVADLNEADTADLVAALVDKSLLAEEPDPVGIRYRMLETVRFFARERNVEAATTADCRDRHLRWATEVVEENAAEFEGAAAGAAVHAVDRVVDEVRAALEWAIESKRHEMVLRVVAPLGWYWVWRGLASEGIAWLDRVPPPVHEGLDPALAARVALTRFQLTTHGEAPHAEVERTAAAAIEAAVAAGDRDLEARTRLWIATHRSFHDPVGRRPDVEAAAALCHEHGGPFWSAMADAHLAQSSMFRLELRAASPFVESAVITARGLGNHQVLAESVARRCVVAEGLGDHHAALEAAADLDEALAGVSMREARALATWSVAIVQLHRGDVDGVVTGMRLAVEEYVRDGDLQFVPLLAAPLAGALTAAGRVDEAMALLEPMWAHPEVRASKVYAVALAPTSAAVLWAAGLPDRARAAVAGYLEVADDIDSPVLRATLQGVLGGFDLDEGSPASAETHLHAAIEVLREKRHRPVLVDAIEELARVELDFGRPAAAAVLLGGAARERQAQGVVLRPFRQATYEETVERARTVLGDDFDGRWEKGRALTLDEVVEFCRRGHGERTRPAFGWDGLTDTERRVAELAAEGLTNPQIAERMVVGRETVKTHMSSVLRKLGLANRTQLARAVPNDATGVHRR